MPVQEHHRRGAHAHLKMGVITASDSRNTASDESGRLIREMLEGAGHHVTHYEGLPETPKRIAEAAAPELPPGIRRSRRSGPCWTRNWTDLANCSGRCRFRRSDRRRF